MIESRWTAFQGLGSPKQPTCSRITAVKQPEVLITSLPSHDAPHSEPELTAQVIISSVIQEVIFPDRQNEPETSSEFSFLTSHDASLSESNISFSKHSKLQKRKMKRKLVVSEKPPQKKENQKIKEREKYASNEAYKANKIAKASRKYENNPEFRQKKRNYIRDNVDFRQKRKEYMSSLYKENAKYREKKKQILVSRYKNDTEFRQKQKQTLVSRYKNDSEFREKQKQILVSRYKNDTEFRQKQKQTLVSRYKNDTEFRQKQKQTLVSRYKNDSVYRCKQKQHFTARYQGNADFRQKKTLYFSALYKDSIEFRQRQRSHITQRYAHDQAFRLRHKQLMRQRMQDRYKNNPTFRSMISMSCAMNIKRKYRQINKPTESDNSLIKEAISVFRSQIKAGPTYVCTICHKASFPNQVKSCKRLNFVKHPVIVAACLTGKYLHVCDDECRNEPQCSVPDERKEEWICHTCHRHLKLGVMPKLAVANNLELADIPPELCDLNILERHLIAKCIAFANYSSSQRKTESHTW